MKAKFETSVSEQAQGQQNSVAYGQRNSVTGAFYILQAYFPKMQYFINKSVLLVLSVLSVLFALAICSVTGQDLQNT